MEKNIVVSDITNEIYLCNTRPVKGHEGLVECVGQKVDVTDKAIKAVYQWFLNHCKEEESGFYQIRYGNKPWLSMQIEKQEDGGIGE